MSVEIKVPPLGESVVEATVGRWLKVAGDSVAAGDPLVELETDKVNMEVAAPKSGILQSIASQEGATVSVGDVLAVIADTQASPNGAAGQSDTEKSESPQPAPPESSSSEDHTEDQAETSSSEEPRATPVARRMAEEHGIDLAHVQGSGPAGRVNRDDIELYLNQNRQPAAAEPVLTPAPAPVRPQPATPRAAPLTGAREEERVRMTRRRQTIARRLVEAQHEAAMLTTFNEVDMSAIMEIRKRRKESFRERYGVNLGFMSFFTRAVVGALKVQPRLNAEIQGDEMVLKHYYDIGIAVSTEEGLVVPVVRNADRLTFAQIEQEIASLAEKARAGTLSLEDLQGGTFTITNGGVFGSLLSTPILNAPQVGILGMHKIQERPVVLNGEIVIRPMMYLALSYDHRIVDGSEAVRFLVRIKELLEDPEALLLEG